MLKRKAMSRIALLYKDKLNNKLLNIIEIKAFKTLCEQYDITVEEELKYIRKMR